ncbi:retrovirus-related pol polyprotein from transposon TNT 1-94, partial [Tanacetum coccineum]
MCDHPVLNEIVQPKSSDNLESVEIQDNVIIEPISNSQPSPSTISPSAEVIFQTPVPQDRWLIKKHIELFNIIGEPLAGITTISRVRNSEAASAHECLYINFLFKMEPKKLIEALEEKSAFLNAKISKEVYVQQLPRFESNEFANHVCKLDKALYGLKQAPKAWYETLSKFLIQHKFVRVKCPMLPPNNLGPDESGVSVNETLFRCMIGSVMYLIASRPDIRFSTCLCA